MKVSIRSETTADIPSIRRLTVEAFRDAPHTDHNEQFIIDALREDDALTVSLVAKVGDVLVGHVSASSVSISDGTPDWYGIGPISVVPRHQGRGIGSMLMERALAELKESGAAGALLLGDPGFYGRFGFQPTEDLNLPGVPPEYFQALHIGKSQPRGVVTYHPAFASKG